MRRDGANQQDSSMDRPQFSAVIPAYNRHDTIGRAIESVLAQSWPPEEIIVIDDGSTDGTDKVVKKFGSSVRYMWQENAGVPCARNRGAREAKCDWVAYLDSDDYWMNDHLAHMADAIEATGGRAGFYFADMQLSEPNWQGSLWELADFKIDGSHQLVDDATDWALLPRQPMMLQTTVFHRQRLLDSRGLHEKLPMRDDTHLFYKMSFGGAACAVAHCGAQMTSDDDSGNRLTSALGDKTLKFWVFSAIMYEDLLARFPSLAAAHRATLRKCLSLSYNRLLRFAWGQGHSKVIIGRIIKGFLMHPVCMSRAFAWMVVGPLRRRRRAAG